MAVETVILRPNSSRNVSSCGHYPAVSEEQIYTLVSEEVADDDATYIYASGTSYVPFLGFDFTEHTNKTPLAIRIVFRAKTTNTNKSIQLFGLQTNESASVIYGDHSLSEVYETYVCNIPNEQCSEFWDTAIRQKEYGEYDIGFGVKVDAGSKDGDETKIYVTQLYLEVDFDNTQIHIKQNGTYAPVSQAYQKVDGTWTAISMSDCELLLSGADVTKVTGIMPKIIFTISSQDTADEFFEKECEAEYGMTWGKWIDSDYNTIGAYLSGEYIVGNFTGYISVPYEADVAIIDRKITPNTVYYILTN